MRWRSQEVSRQRPLNPIKIPSFVDNNITKKKAQKVISSQRNGTKAILSKRILSGGLPHESERKRPTKNAKREREWLVNPNMSGIEEDRAAGFLVNKLEF